MNTHELATKALEVMLNADWNDRESCATVDGFTFIYNHETGQSKFVVFHAESGLVFKTTYYSTTDEGYDVQNLSGRLLGEVTWDGVTYPVRLPLFEYYDVDGRIVEVQEYVDGTRCECETGWSGCIHTPDMKRVTQCADAHYGNWKISSSGEIVLFDFDGIRI